MMAPEFQTMSYSKIAPSYEAVAEEYYDVTRHPTCRNFGDLTNQFLYPRIQQFAYKTERALEIGAGKSIVAEIFEGNSLPLSRVTILDQSPGMLKYSEKWISAGAIAKLADAKKTQLHRASFDLIVSSLGDPYNCEEFWQEMRRIIIDHGVLLFTTPSFEWSSKFRNASKPDRAEFSLRDGRSVLVPSFTRPISEQRAMMGSFGFRVVDEYLPIAKDIGGYISPKLEVINETEPVLYCFTLTAIPYSTP